MTALANQVESRAKFWGPKSDFADFSQKFRFLGVAEKPHWISCLGIIDAWKNPINCYFLMLRRSLIKYVQIQKKFKWENLKSVYLIIPSLSCLRDELFLNKFSVGAWKLSSIYASKYQNFSFVNLCN
jgi:hypothetical protein